MAQRRRKPMLVDFAGFRVDYDAAIERAIGVSRSEDDCAFRGRFDSTRGFKTSAFFQAIARPGSG